MDAGQKYVVRLVLIAVLIFGCACLGGELSHLYSSLAHHTMTLLAQ